MKQNNTSISKLTSIPPSPAHHNRPPACFHLLGLPAKCWAFYIRGTKHCFVVCNWQFASNVSKDRLLELEVLSGLCGLLCTISFLCVDE